jgi:aspartate beta-hydroxylase
MKTAAIYDRASAWLRGVYDRGITTPAVLDPTGYFPSAQRFVSSWEALREEALAIKADLSSVPRFQDLMTQQEDIAYADMRDWRMFVVKAYGVDFSANAARCPKLAALVAQCPEVLTATLSFLAPYKHVPRHRGPFRGVIRYYLALSVPTGEDGRPGTTLTVDGTDYHVGNGQALLWDDTFAHEVNNRTGDVRIALLLDVRRRGMPLRLELLTRMLIAAIGLTVRLRKPA